MMACRKLMRDTHTIGYTLLTCRSRLLICRSTCGVVDFVVAFVVVVAAAAATVSGFFRFVGDADAGSADAFVLLLLLVVVVAVVVRDDVPAFVCMVPTEHGGQKTERNGTERKSSRCKTKECTPPTISNRNHDTTVTTEWARMRIVAQRRRTWWQCMHGVVTSTLHCTESNTNHHHKMQCMHAMPCRRTLLLRSESRHEAAVVGNAGRRRRRRRALHCCGWARDGLLRRRTNNGNKKRETATATATATTIESIAKRNKWKIDRESRSERTTLWAMLRGDDRLMHAIVAAMPCIARRTHWRR